MEQNLNQFVQFTLPGKTLFIKKLMRIHFGLILCCIFFQPFYSTSQTTNNGKKYVLLDSSVLKNCKQIFILFHTNKYTIFTTDSIFFQNFLPKLAKSSKDELCLAINDSLKKDSLKKVVYLDDIVFSILKRRIFYMPDLMKSEALVYNKYTRRLEKYIYYLGFVTEEPYHGWTDLYKIGKTVIWEDVEPWY